MFEQDAWGRNRLHWAALSGDLDDVKILVGKGFPITTQDNDGYTAFRLAVRANNLDVVKFFVSAGVRVTRMCIRHAELKGHKEMSNFLIKTLLDQSPKMIAPQPQRVMPGIFSEDQMLRLESVRLKK